MDRLKPLPPAPDAHGREGLWDGLQYFTMLNITQHYLALPSIIEHYRERICE